MCLLQGQQLILGHGGLEPAACQILLNPSQQMSGGGSFLLIPQGQGSLVQPLPPGLAMTHHAASQAMASPRTAQAQALAAAAAVAASAGQQALLSNTSGLQTSQSMTDPAIGSLNHLLVNTSSAPAALSSMGAPTQQLNTSQGMQRWT